MEDTNLYSQDSVFIIGNGFDLDLGFKVSYMDFMKSSYWPFGKVDLKQALESQIDFGDQSQGAYILREYLSQRVAEGWFDLEEIMFHFAIEDSCILGNLEEESKKDYVKLNDSLRSFIKHRFKMRIKKVKHDSCAAKVLKAIVENKRYKIYSFNYTDLLEEARQLGINQE